jgi:hypothetical protein
MHPSCLALDQQLLVAGERLEFLHEGAVRRQGAQRGEVAAPVLGQAIGGERLRLGSRRRPASFQRLGVDRSERAGTLPPAAA